MNGNIVRSATIDTESGAETVHKEPQMRANEIKTLDFMIALLKWYDLLYLAQGIKRGAYNLETVEAFDSLFRKTGTKRILDCACGAGDPTLTWFS